MHSKSKNYFHTAEPMMKLQCQKELERKFFSAHDFVARDRVQISAHAVVHFEVAVMHAH